MPAIDVFIATGRERLAKARRRASGLYKRALQNCHIHVPVDMSLLAFDDFEWLSLLTQR